MRLVDSPVFGILVPACWRDERGEHGLGNALLSEPFLSLVWRSVAEECPGQEWHQPGLQTGPVSGVWAECLLALRHRLLRTGGRASDFRHRYSRTRRGKFGALYRPDRPTR